MIRKIKTRIELIHMLCQAAEIEHQLLLIYLFSSFSLKQNISEGGITEEQLQKIKSWKRRMVGVAIEEMTHLSIVSNLLTSIGGAPHFTRPNLPQDEPKYYPDGFRMDLIPFGREALQRFVAYEHPNNVKLIAPSFEKRKQAKRKNMLQKIDSSQIVAAEITYHTIHDLYSCIRKGFELLAAINPSRLFIGNEKSQLTNSKHLRLFKELIPVCNLNAVEQSIEIILEQGEGNNSDIEGHFKVFKDILEEYEAELKSSQENNKAFEPARPCIENPFLHQPSDSSSVNIITDEFTAEVSLLFNASYDLMMKIIVRAFAHHEETNEEIALLADVFISFMHDVISPLGELLTTLPAGKHFPGKTAGPSFEFSRDLHLIPHKNPAWIIFVEEMEMLSAFAAEISIDELSSENCKIILVDVAEKMKGFAGKLRRD